MVQKPNIIIAVDNSLSITQTKDSSSYKNELLPKINELQERLSDKFQVEIWPFGSIINRDKEVNLNFNQTGTNISNVIEEANNSFFNSNLGAIVLLTDGLYNQGENPVYAAQNLPCSVYSVLLGDTNQYKDVLINNVQHNDIVYEANAFEIAVSVKAIKAKNAKLNVWLEHQGKVLSQTTIFSNNEDFFENVKLTVPGLPEGVAQLTARVTEISNEVSRANNSSTFKVTVLKSKLKISLVYLSVHPDVGAIKNALLTNPNYEVKLFPVTDFTPAELKNSDIVIAHQIPSKGGVGQWLIQRCQTDQIPLFLIIGNQSDILGLNATDLLSVQGHNGTFNQVQPLAQESFNLFQLTPEELLLLQSLPPLSSPYGLIKPKAEHQVLFYQLFGYVKTQNPLLYFQRTAAGFNAVLCGEGFWQWRLHEYKLKDHTETTSALINKIVQLISNKTNKNKWIVRIPDKPFNEGDEVKITASLYNQSYELYNEPSAEIKVTDKENKVFNYNFSKAGKEYTLNMGLLRPGYYKFEAKVLSYVAKGGFWVMPSQIEYLTTAANGSVLSQISSETNGKLISYENLDKLADIIDENSDIKPVIYYQNQMKELVHVQWILALILTFLFVEWAIRKYNGYL